MDAYDVFVMRFESNVNRRYLPIPGLQRVFGIDQKTAERIAQSLPRVVKRRVTLDVAAQYAEALREIGAEVQLRPCRNDSNFNTDSTPPMERASIPSSPTAMSPSGIDESTVAKNAQVGATQATPPEVSNAAGVADTLDEKGLNHSNQQSTETPASQIPLQSSLTAEPNTPGSQTAQNARQPIDELSTGRANGANDDRPSRTSTRPSPDTDASAHGSIRPHPLKQDEQNPAPAINTASPPQATPNPTGLSQGTGSVSPYAANYANSPLGYSPSSFPVNTASTEDPIPIDALKKSFWAPGTGLVIGGSVLIFIGLSYDGSVFTGNAGILDCIFDALGLCLIGWGLFKLFKKDGSQL